MDELPCAEDVGHYWMTSKTGADGWIDDAMEQIKAIGGEVLAYAFGIEPGTGRAAYMLRFRVGADSFRIVWPVLPSRTGRERAARVQAATFLYHDVKARCMRAAVFGARAAFFEHLVLPDGRTAGDLAAPELARAVPAMLTTTMEDRT